MVTEDDKQTPPSEGWTYYRSGWKSDPTLVVSREVTPVCSEIILEVKGEAKKRYPKLSGRYLPVKGKINRGRWVGSYTDNNNTPSHITIVILMQISSYMCV